MGELKIYSGGLDLSNRDNEFLWLLYRDLEMNMHIYTNQEYVLSLSDSLIYEMKKRGLIK